MLTLLACSLLWLQSTASPPSATVKVFGAVARPTTFSAAEIAAMPRTEISATSHNQAGKYAGPSMRELLTRVGVPTGADLRGAELAKTVIVTGADGYKVAFAIAEFDPSFTERNCILADQKNGAPLPANAAPFQIILSGEVRPARWVRQVVSIEVRPAP